MTEVFAGSEGIVIRTDDERIDKLKSRLTRSFDWRSRIKRTRLTETISVRRIGKNMLERPFLGSRQHPL